jgi:hypothetical protein
MKIIYIVFTIPYIICLWSFIKNYIQPGKFIYKEDEGIKQFLNKCNNKDEYHISSYANNNILFITTFKTPYTIRYSVKEPFRYLGNRQTRTIFPFTKLHYKIKRYNKLLSKGLTYDQINRDNILNDILN